MIKPEQVPDEVVEAARDALFSDKGMRGAIAAGLAAWPGKDIVGYGPPFYGIDLILPLTEAPQGRIPTETDNDKA